MKIKWSDWLNLHDLFAIIDSFNPQTFTFTLHEHFLFMLQNFPPPSPVWTPRAETVMDESEEEDDEDFDAMSSASESGNDNSDDNSDEKSSESSSDEFEAE